MQNVSAVYAPECDRLRCSLSTAPLTPSRWRLALKCLWPPMPHHVGTSAMRNGRFRQIEETRVGTVHERGMSAAESPNPRGQAPHSRMQKK